MSQYLVTGLWDLSDLSGLEMAAGAAIRYTSGRAEGRYQMDRSQVEKVSKALADDTRLRIFEAISCGTFMNCAEIVSLRGITPATVSHHLKILSEAGLITRRRKGQFVCSKAVPETITAYTRALTRLAAGKKKGRRTR